MPVKKGLPFFITLLLLLFLQPIKAEGDTITFYYKTKERVDTLYVYDITEAMRGVEGEYDLKLDRMAHLDLTKYTATALPAKPWREGVQFVFTRTKPSRVYYVVSSDDRVAPIIIDRDDVREVFLKHNAGGRPPVLPPETENPSTGDRTFGLLLVQLALFAVVTGLLAYVLRRKARA